MTDDKYIMRLIVDLLSHTHGWKLFDVVLNIKCKLTKTYQDDLEMEKQIISTINTLIHNGVINSNNGNLHTNMKIDVNERINDIYSINELVKRERLR